jgi:hypothetical protein
VVNVNDAAVAEVTEAPQRSTFFSTLMAKNLKRKREQGATVEEDEVRTRLG